MQPVQLRMARAALDLSVDQLAAKAGLSHVEVARVEDGTDGDGALTERLKAALEEAGIQWIDDNGVRFVGAGDAGGIPIEDLTADNDAGAS